MPGGKKEGPRKTLIAAVTGLILLCILAAAVVWWLPDIADRRGGGQEFSQSTGTTATKEAAPPGVDDPAHSGSDDTGKDSARQLAVEAEQTWLEKKAEAQLENMQQWGGGEYARAMQISEQAIDRLRQGQFSNSANLFIQASEIIDSIKASREQILEHALQSGKQALKQGNQKEAESAFNTALAIDRTNSEAMTGLRRSRTIAKVHAMLKEAQRLMDAENPADASELLGKILKIDAECVRAQELLQKADLLVRRQKYDRAMGQAISALASGRYSESEKALKQASALFPSDPAAAELRGRLQEARTASALNNLIGQADKARGKEEWQRAIELYRKALAMDPLSVAARHGLALSEKRFALEKALEKIINNPWNLNEKGPFSDAQDTVRMARAVKNPGPVLLRLTAAAEQILRRSRQKVNVTFISDNLTDVVIYHVGRLGKFDKRDIKLKPGIYTVKGMREGYRDVRRKVQVRPDAGAVRVDIRCREKI
jgi:tetratricopeptide (TPR) repeat protein